MTVLWLPAELLFFQMVGLRGSFSRPPPASLANKPPSCKPLVGSAALENEPSGDKSLVQALFQSGVGISLAADSAMRYSSPLPGNSGWIYSARMFMWRTLSNGPVGPIGR